MSLLAANVDVSDLGNDYDTQCVQQYDILNDLTPLSTPTKQGAYGLALLVYLSASSVVAVASQH